MTVPCDDATVLPYVAYLRVYEPLSVFPEDERSAWAAYATDEDRAERASVLDIEHRQALRRAVAVPPIVAPAHESQEAYIRRVEGATYVCPLQTRLRSWLALQEFKARLPEKVVGAFLPPAVTAEVLLDFERWQQRNLDERPRIMTTTWHVPVQWFVPFDPGERWLVLGGRGQPPHEGAGPATAAPTRTLVYVTAMAQARRRVARSLAVIRRGVGGGAAMVGVEELGRWLEEFHPHSLVELDYGGLVHLLDDERLRADQSVADVGAALTALETGHPQLAMVLYERLVGRWRVVRALESAN